MLVLVVLVFKVSLMSRFQLMPGLAGLPGPAKPEIVMLAMAGVARANTNIEKILKKFINFFIGFSFPRDISIVRNWQ
jgi:hypothetical protein